VSGGRITLASFEKLKRKGDTVQTFNIVVEGFQVTPVLIRALLRGYFGKLQCSPNITVEEPAQLCVEPTALSAPSSEDGSAEPGGGSH